MLRLKVLTRQNAARSEFDIKEVLAIYKSAKSSLIQCLLSEPLGLLQKLNPCISPTPGTFQGTRVRP